MNKKAEVGDDSTEEENEEEPISKKKPKAPAARTGKRQPAKNMPKHDEENEEETEPSIPTKPLAKGKGNRFDRIHLDHFLLFSNARRGRC